MRIIYMGTPDFAVPVLESLVQSKHEVIAVITQPDKQKGRGKAVSFSPVKEKALEYGIPVYQPVKVKNPEFVDFLEILKPDCIVVTAFGQILSKRILDLPKYGCFNVHASLLPAYRGSAPMQWCIIDGQKETGITIMQMDAGIDTGDMLNRIVIPIDSKETAESLHDKMSVLGGPLLLETLEQAEAGTLKPEKQDDRKSCYARMLTKELGKIDWNKSAIELERLVRGLNSWPSAYTSFRGKTLKIWEADVVSSNSDSKVGQVVDILGGTICVQTGDGILKLVEVQLEGKTRMKADAFLNGYRLEVGEILG